MFPLPACFVSCLLVPVLWLEFPTKIHAKLDQDSLVEIYDGVLDSDVANWLQDECVKWDKGNSVSVSPLEQPERHVPIAQFLDRFLHQLYPGITKPKYYVKFWKRTQWHHIQAHADMDETGHVLYLQVGRHVRGPTVVWNVTKGGELVEKDQKFEMITIPAVPGRLLRFQGSALHDVPRPADVYWTHIEDDEDSYEQDVDQRSVLLFNLWPVEQGMLVGYETLDGTDTSSRIPDYIIGKAIQQWTSVDVVPYQETPEYWM